MRKKWRNIKNFNEGLKYLQENEFINEVKNFIENECDKRSSQPFNEELAELIIMNSATTKFLEVKKFFAHLVHVLLSSARNSAVRASVHKFFKNWLPWQNSTLSEDGEHLFLIVDYYKDDEFAFRIEEWFDEEYNDNLKKYFNI